MFFFFFNTCTGTCSGNIVFDQLLASVKDLNVQELSSLMAVIGNVLQPHINADLERLDQAYKDIDKINEIDVRERVEERNAPLRAFLGGVAGTSHNRDYLVAKAIESVYHLRNHRIVLPLSFSENLVAYSITNSKLATNMNRVGGGGGYESIRRWLNTSAEKPLRDVKGDVAVAFDNDQVIGKSYHSRADNSLNTSIITAVCVAEVEKDGQLHTAK